MKKSNLSLLFLLGFSTTAVAQIPVKLKYEIRNETRDPIYFAVGTKKNGSLAKRLSPVKQKSSATNEVTIKDKEELPVFLITDSLKNDRADKIYFYPTQDLKTQGIKNKTILIKVKDAPLRENISLQYEFGDSNKMNFFEKKDFIIELIEISERRQEQYKSIDPYKILTAILKGFTSLKDLEKLPKIEKDLAKDFAEKGLYYQQEGFVTANSPAHRILGFPLNTNPETLKSENIEKQWMNIREKVQYLNKIPELYKQVTKIIDEAKATLLEPKTERDPYKLITAALKGITSYNAVQRLPKEEILTQNSPSNFILGIRTIPQSREEVEAKWNELKNKVEYLRKQDPEDYRKVRKIIDDARIATVRLVNELKSGLTYERDPYRIITEALRKLGRIPKNQYVTKNSRTEYILGLERVPKNQDQINQYTQDLAKQVAKDLNVELTPELAIKDVGYEQPNSQMYKLVQKILTDAHAKVSTRQP